jgi:hypothetical protein
MGWGKGGLYCSGMAAIHQQNAFTRTEYALIETSRVESEHTQRRRASKVVVSKDSN